jgi:hypothetical protein
MARILNRPLFRKGGSTNEGIMHGLVDRKGYLQGTDNPWIKEAKEALRTDAPRDTSLSEMLVGGGLNLVSGAGAGEGLMANVAKSYKGPSETFFEKQRAARDYERKTGQAAAQMGLEQKWKLEQIRARDDPNKALRNVYLTQAIEDGYDAPEAQRIADYQITTKTELQNKVGRERLGGIIEFDLNDEKQKKKQLPKMKKDIGKYFYDPYDNKIKLLTEQNGVLGFVEFNSVADITFGDLPGEASTVSSTPYADAQAAIEQEKSEGILTDEDIIAQRFP